MGQIKNIKLHIVTDIKMIPSRFYIKKSLVSIEEDEYNEFKGHRSISIEELPPWCFQPNSDRRTRKPVSRTLNAFLNSGRGGTLYLGIIDEGVVKGFYLTEYQKDHVRVAIKDVFSRYQPKVDDDKYEVNFVPVLEKHESIEDVVSQISEEQKSHSVEDQVKSHLLRTYDFCWCDQNLAERIDSDKRPRDYIIEIKIQRQKTSFNYFSDGSFKADLPITYMGEEGKCFFRTSASCKEYSLQSCKELAVQQLKDIYTPIIKALRRDLDSLQDDLDSSDSSGEEKKTYEVRKFNEDNVCKEVRDY